MEKREWHKLVSQPQYGMKTTKDIFVPMRDGVKLAVDVYHPNAEGKFPALLSLSCYGKDVQKLSIVPGPIDFRIGNGGIEAGNSEYFVSRGYVHVIADSRGTGISEGAYRFLSHKEQEDGYDLVEWIASQPWCDGNVGMLGMSYFGMIQYLIAALNPPHLRAIFAHDALTDVYRMFLYNGGILDYGFFFQWWPHVPAHTIEPLDVSAVELAKMVEEAKKERDVQACPVAYITLGLPEKNIPLFDALVYPNDGPYYWERSAWTKFDRIKIPIYLLSRWTGWSAHLPGAFSGYLGIDAPKKLRIGLTELGGGFGRPWGENHDIILRWYDHWLKGIDTGIMDEPPINIYVQGENKWRFEQEWPLARTEWTKFYLRKNGTLSMEQPTPGETPDSFTNVPRLLQGQKAPAIMYQTAAFMKDTEVTGPIALYFYAALSTEDGNWMAEIHDVAPDGSQKLISMGWLRASHRELDSSKSTLYKPFHPHTKRSPVIPGAVYEYAMEIADTSCVFKVGHKIQLTVKGQDSPWDGPEGFRELCYHLSNANETQHTLYHDTEYPSYLLLPIIPSN